MAAEPLGIAAGAALRLAMAGPDFVLREARLSREVVSSGQTLSLTLTLDNVGASYVAADHGTLKVVASLNGPVGVGTQLGSFTLGSSLPGNASRAVSIPLTLPAGVSSDERQTVFIDIVGSADANSIDSSADHDRIEINAMPVPVELNASTRADAPFVNLVWSNPSDTRIAGWRIWKLDADGSWQHLGSTRFAGYVDITATVGATMTYRVAAYSANGMESEPSEPISARIALTRANGIFGNGFETTLP
jgi:hypothetical protein